MLLDFWIAQGRMLSYDWVYACCDLGLNLWRFSLSVQRQYRIIHVDFNRSCLFFLVGCGSSGIRGACFGVANQILVSKFSPSNLFLDEQKMWVFVHLEKTGSSSGSINNPFVDGPSFSWCKRLLFVKLTGEFWFCVRCAGCERSCFLHSWIRYIRKFDPQTDCKCYSQLCHKMV